MSRKNGIPTPIVDKNGKPTTVYRVDKTSEGSVQRIQQVISGVPQPESSSVEAELNAALRTSFPRAHFFSEVRPYAEDPTFEHITVYHDLNPYGERSEPEVEDVKKSLMRSLTRYFYVEETDINDSDFPKLNVMEIADRPTSVSDLESRMKEGAIEPEDIALATRVTEEFRLQALGDQA